MNTTLQTKLKKTKAVQRRSAQYVTDLYESTCKVTRLDAGYEEVMGVHGLGEIIIIIIMEFIYIALVQLQQEPQAHYNGNN